jgi:hypothetical protein
MPSTAFRLEIAGAGMPRQRKSTPHKERLFKRFILRRHAERYILITLLSFALTVGITRFFLYITGYPQLGFGGIHISHVLWGGLFLFAAAVLLLSFINQKLFILSAIFSGLGIGLFIDEVGKFITADYNYFIPSAAPIVYTFFLLTALVYTLIVRRSRNDSRMELYQLLGDLEEILDEDYTEEELKQLMTRIEAVKEKPAYRDLKPIALGLEKYFEQSVKPRPKSKSSILDKLNTYWLTFRDRHLRQRRFKSILVGGLLGISLWELFYPATFIINFRSPETLLDQLSQLVTSELVTGPVTIGLFVIRLGFNIILGCALLAAVFLFIINRDRKASATAYVSLLVLLTTANLVFFYFDQFSMIINASVQFLLLIATIYYRRKYLDIAL